MSRQKNSAPIPTKKVRALNTASSHCSPALLRALSPEFCGLAWRWASSLSPSPACFYCSSPPVWRRCWWPHGSGWRRTWLAHHHGAQSWTIKIWLDFLVQEKRIRWPRKQSRFGTDMSHSQGCEAEPFLVDSQFWKPRSPMAGLVVLSATSNNFTFVFFTTVASKSLLHA